MANVNNQGVVTLNQKGDFKNSIKFLRALSEKSYFKKIESFAEKGRAALAAATPVDTGKTAASWKYEIKEDDRGLTISWINDNKSNNVPIVVLLYYGHATPSGRFVQGRDFITPAIEPVFKEIIDSVWKEVTNA